MYVFGGQDQELRVLNDIKVCKREYTSPVLYRTYSVTGFRLFEPAVDHSEQN